MKPEYLLITSHSKAHSPEKIDKETLVVSLQCEQTLKADNLKNLITNPLLKGSDRSFVKRAAPAHVLGDIFINRQARSKASMHRQV